MWLARWDLQHALPRAGFHEVEVVWQEMENRILLGIR